MKVLILDGHPDCDRLTTVLLSRYAEALPEHVEHKRIAVRDLRFDPTFLGRPAGEPPLEPDLQRLWAAMADCDHLVLGFPLWWGAEPGPLKGLFDRMLQPDYAFRYRDGGRSWDRLLAGRTADVLITMDTPPLILRLLFADPIGQRLRRQVLGFCGFHPLRIYSFGPVHGGGAERNITAWSRVVARAARSCEALRRVEKVTSPQLAALVATGA